MMGLFATGMLMMVGSTWADEDTATPPSAAGGTVGGVAAPSDAATVPPPAWRVTYEALFVARYNPLGLNAEFRPAIRRRLYASTSTIGRDNYIDVAPTITATPAFVRGGVSMRVQPAAVIRLGARVEGINYFGGFDQLQSWPSAERAAWDDDALDAGGNYGTTGWFGAGEVLLRAKVQNIAVLNQTRLLYADLELANDDSTFYEITYDVLVADQGFFHNNDFSVVWVPSDPPLTLGARWSSTRAYHPNEPDSVAAQGMHRVGPLVAWKLRGTEGQGVGSLTAFTMAQWWLAHPYRTGDSVSQGVPYFLLGLSMSGDFIPWP